MTKKQYQQEQQRNMRAIEEYDHSESVEHELFSFVTGLNTMLAVSYRTHHNMSE